jgi:hypothetical protein
MIDPNILISKDRQRERERDGGLIRVYVHMKGNKAKQINDEI